MTESDSALTDSERFVTIATHVSQAFCCEVDRRKNRGRPAWFEPVMVPHADDDAVGTAPDRPAVRSRKKKPASRPVFWMDELLHGGFRVPQHSPAAGRTHRGLSILVSGPPGTGKSTFVLELAYRMATREPALRTLYLTTETPAQWLRDKGVSLWGKKVLGTIIAAETLEDVRRHDGVAVYPTDKLDEDLRRLSGIKPVEALLADLVRGLFGHGTEFRETTDDAYSAVADVLVLDSLNVVPDQANRKRLASVLFGLASTTRMLIAIVDTGPKGSESEFWEYLADVVIRLDRTYPTLSTTGYMLRTIEIMKARYQQHVWGPHQMKIYAGAFDKLQRKKDETLDVFVERVAREHPYRREGGIFIFPSFHFLLSKYKRQDPFRAPEYDPSAVPGLNRLLRVRLENGPSGEKAFTSGYPRGRCTAFIGERGGHKSHLAFMEALIRLLPEDDPLRPPDTWFSPDGNRWASIVVSLRDDAGTIVQTMRKILADWGRSKGSERPEQRAEEFLQKAIYRNLDIMYFPPGNITVDEFIHRIWIAINRLKYGKIRASHIFLVFNSLDQLGARFPLCASEPSFIAALTHILSAENVTCVFVAASEREESGDYHGLDSIAELILEFRHEELGARERRAILTQLPASVQDSPESWPDEGSRVVVVKVVRFAGGQSAGARAALELVEDQEHPLHALGLRGLQCWVV